LSDKLTTTFDIATGQRIALAFTRLAQPDIPSRCSGHMIQETTTAMEVRS
jgi:hypothetical protein